jgi:two-component system nitrate/nitrite sensor histidine kinase NarX
VFAIGPSLYDDVISPGDILHVVFFLFLVVAFQAESRATLRDLQTSHAALVHLRDADVLRAILLERARLAREVHDGLTQELWLAKLRFGEFVDSLGPARPEVDAAAADVRSALDSAIAEARHAIVALSVSSDPSTDFVGTLAAYVEDAGDRLGVPVTMDVRLGPVAVSLRTSAEVTRIVQEALANVRRHAAASEARVSVEQVDRRIRVVVEDDGRGFRADVATAGHGIQSMRERARAIHGELRIEHPEQGTRVVLEFPAPAATGAPVGT